MTVTSKKHRQHMLTGCVLSYPLRQLCVASRQHLLDSPENCSQKPSLCHGICACDMLIHTQSQRDISKYTTQCINFLQWIISLLQRAPAVADSLHWILNRIRLPTQTMSSSKSGLVILFSGDTCSACCVCVPFVVENLIVQHCCQWTSMDVV